MGEKAIEIVNAPADRLIMLSVQNSPVLQQVGGMFIAAVKEIVEEGYGAANVLEEAQDNARPLFQTP